MKILLKTKEVTTALGVSKLKEAELPKGLVIELEKSNNIYVFVDHNGFSYFKSDFEEPTTIEKLEYYNRRRHEIKSTMLQRKD